jgi:hypothetical protein
LPHIQIRLSENVFETLVGGSRQGIGRRARHQAVGRTVPGGGRGGSRGQVHGGGEQGSTELRRGHEGGSSPQLSWGELDPGHVVGTSAVELLTGRRGHECGGATPRPPQASSTPSSPRGSSRGGAWGGSAGEHGRKVGGRDLLDARDRGREERRAGPPGGHVANGAGSAGRWRTSHALEAWRRRGRSEKIGTREVEDDPDVWATRQW